jgi:Zn finger protein HypA/HybF involved in hydrogenase expression
LVFQRVPARFHCPTCGEIFAPEGQGHRTRFQVWTCPSCGELRPEVIGGREFLVDSIEVE